MKKYYRIGICLVLVVCLLLLSACGKKQDPPANDPTQPTSDLTQATGETTGTKPSENPTETTGIEPDTPQEDGKSDLPKELAFNWKDSYFQLAQMVNLTPLENGVLLTHKTLQDEITRLSWLSGNETQSEYEKKVERLSRPETFFDHNSLILIGTTSKLSTLDITDVSYSDGILKCSVTRAKRVPLPQETVPTPPPSDFGRFNQPVMFYCFIEIDTVLPEGTEIVVEITDVTVDNAAFKTNFFEFTEKCVWYKYDVNPKEFDPYK